METCEVKVTNLGKIGWGVRIWDTTKEGKKFLWADLVVKDRLDIGPNIKEQLRMLNKSGSPSKMAEASRDRFFC